jgi:DNA mismatch repair protein MutL
MPSIQILPENLCNKIAAGEIVERPASIVKELVENSVDAGATRITIDVEESGRRLIRVSDDGGGMEPEDARQAFLRHATSKLRTEADLSAIRTMGFRGEALPSIGAVARVRMVTAPAGGGDGTEIRIRGGTIDRTQVTAAPVGTVVEVEELFYNTPARKKFLKSNATELSHILHAVQQQALPNFGIHFRLTHNGAILLELPAVRDELERVAQGAGREAGEDLLEVALGPDAAVSGIRLKGWISKPGYFRTSRDHQEFFINRRAIKNPSLSHALTDAYGTLLARGRHPVAYLFIEMDPASVDVNVHPAKREVRFRDTQAIHRAVKDTLRERLRREGLPVEPSAEATPYSLSGSPAARPYPEGGPPASPGRPEAGSREQLREASEIYRPLLGPDEVPQAAGSRESAEGLRTPGIQPLGQVDRTYIVATFAGDSGPELHLIDQHAAHERLLFEQLMAQRRNSGIDVQPLLIPEVTEFGAAEALRLREMLPMLGGIGLEVEEFGERSFRIRSAPALLGTIDGRSLLRDILDDAAAGAVPTAEETLESVIASMACHAAIKAHQALQTEQMSRLLDDLYRYEVPPTCPHGRPIRVRFGRPELEKWFQRR